MNYSIVIPVFNKAALTRQCLATLRPTLDGAGEGEVIVVDNGSSDETPEMLAEFPWIRLIRNETNRGFAAANNQGARVAQGRFLVLLNNDTQAKPGWLAAMLNAASQPDVGIVGARLLYPSGTLQHAGVFLAPLLFGKAGFYAAHDLAGAAGTHPYAAVRREYAAVTAACLLTPRELYLEVGGLDEGFWNGYEDVDYCLQVRARGLRVVYAGDAVVTHFESQSGAQRFRKVSWNISRLAERWNGRVHCDMLEHEIARGTIRRTIRVRRGNVLAESIPIPKSTIVVHGQPGPDAALEKRLRENRAPVERVLWTSREAAVETVRREMEVRGDRYLVLVDAACAVQAGWLDELVRQIAWAPNIGAAAYASSQTAPLEDRSLPSAGAACTLIALDRYPQHERIADLATLDSAVEDFLNRGLALRAGIRAASKPLVEVPPRLVADPFESQSEEIERCLRVPLRRRAGLVTICMLSWNAVEYTKIALESIRKYTNGDYEVVIVDNGSGPETVDWLRTLTDVKVIFNSSNRGYAGGNNQAMAVASGEYVVLLNNDVVVTHGWLEGLLSAFDRIPALGVSAPRSNIIAGDQVVLDASYTDLEQMHRYAEERRVRYRGRGYMTDRAVGLCLCIDRRVIDEIGGIDERFGVGNFEDDDFCMRVRAAGYRIQVCDDVFIHHFGSKTFAANNVDWASTMRENWSKFAAKWELPPQQVDGGYQPLPVIRRGFVREKHYFALPAQTPESTQGDREYEIVFTAAVRHEQDWNDIGNFARRYVRAFVAQQPVLFAIAALGELGADEIGTRVTRIAEKEGFSAEGVADIFVSDESEFEAWVASLRGRRVCRIDELTERSPSALRRLLKATV